MRAEAWASSAESGDALEVRLEHDGSFRSGQPADERVQLHLVLHRLAVRSHVTVVDDDERRPGPAWQISMKSGMLALPPHSTIEICSRSASWPSAWNTNGKGDLLGHAFDENRRPREEELGTLRVELAHHPKRVVDVDRPQPFDRGHAEVVTADEIDLLERGETEETRGVRGEEDLVAAIREVSDEPAQIPVRVRGEKQLRLLDRENDARDIERAGLEPADESHARSRRSFERLLDHALYRLRRWGVDRDRHEVASAKSCRKVDDRRGSGSLFERDGAAVGKRRLDRERTLSLGYVGRREIEARVE